MNWSWHIGKVFGIDLKIHLTFFFLLIWIGFLSLTTGGTLTAVAGEILFILSLFLLVVMHEFGHALTAKKFGVATRDITLLPIGGVARLETMPEDPKEEFLVAIAGPAVNIVIGAIIFVALILTGSFSQPINIATMIENFWVRLFLVNMTLVVFNLIPAFPMDGGRVLRALLATRIEHVKATQIAANIGRGFAVLMGIAGLIFNPWLILTAIFVWSGAGAEAKAVKVKSSIKGLTVQDALVSQFYQVEANQSLMNVFQLSIETGQKNIPVVSNGHFLGLISRQNLMRSIDRYGNRAPAYTAIDSEPKGLNPHTALIDVLEKFSANRVLPVIQDRQLIGLVTPESVQQRIWLNERIKTSSGIPTNKKTDLA